MLPLWLIYTTISGLSSVAFNFISRYVLKDGHDSTAYSWWFEMFRFIIFLPFALPVLNSINNLPNLALFVAIGFSEFLSIYFYMKMHSHVDLSISSVVTQTRLLWVPLFAFLFLSEKLNYKSYLAILIIIVGQIIVSLNGKAKTKFTLERGIKYALVASVFVSFNNVLGKPASVVFPIQIIPVAMALPSLFLFPLFMKQSKQRILDLGRIKGKKIFLAALFNAVTMIFLLLGLRQGLVGKVTSLYQSLSIIQVFLGIILLKENKNIKRKVIGSVIVLLGVFLLI